MSKEKETKKDEGILGQISDQAISSMMEENRVFPVPAEFAKKAAVKEHGGIQEALGRVHQRTPTSSGGKSRKSSTGSRNGTSMRITISKTILKSGTSSAEKSTSPITASTAISRPPARTKPRLSGRASRTAMSGFSPINSCITKYANSPTF